MTHYIILTHRSALDLERIVNDKIKEGYRPTGGICIAVENTTFTNKYDGIETEISYSFWQAMIK